MSFDIVGSGGWAGVNGPGWSDGDYVGDDVDALIDMINGNAPLVMAQPANIGAAPAFSPQQMQQMQQMQRLQQQTKQLNANDLPVGVWGLAVTSVGTLASATITAALSAYARPDRLVMGQSACVALSRITAISVGTINLTIGAQPLPCECFRYDAVGTRLRAAVVASPSVPPTVSVYNGTGATIIYEGAFFGPATRTPPPGVS
jgi:hypothetical protein